MARGCLHELAIAGAPNSLPRAAESSSHAGVTIGNRSRAAHDILAVQGESERATRCVV